MIQVAIKRGGREYLHWIEYNKKNKMKNRNMKTGLICSLIILLFAGGSYRAQAQSDYSLKSVTGSVSGTSTLHDWKSAITKVSFKGLVKSDESTITSIKDVEVTIPVSGIISTEGKSMDKKTYKAFHSDKNPLITYTFSEASVRKNVAGGMTIEASGKLTMAGVTLPETLTASVKRLSGGELELAISKKLKMTEFKMKPPTALLGTITSGDEIVLDFKLVLTQNKPLASK
jgi:polyisoprenoid-binding protein YceI